MTGEWRNRDEMGKVSALMVWQEAGDQAAAAVVCEECGEAVPAEEMEGHAAEHEAGALGEK